jgi:phosphatidylglycerophosphate synthase/CBS domain-containing protein
MNPITALIVRDTSPIRFAGLDLVERARRLMRRVGIDQVQVVDDERPFGLVDDAELLLVVPERVVAEPAVFTALLERGLRCAEEAAVVMDATGASTDLALMSWRALARVRTARRLRTALHRLSVESTVGAVTMPERFVVRLRDAREVGAVERAYMRHTNGGDKEGFFTKNIRRFSIPLSTRLVRTGVTANQVTLAGFALSVAAGLSFAAGSYWWGIAGALLYVVSMVFDCSDGEVARALLGDSKFGAWLETVTDYLSYFVVLGGIVWGDVSVEGFCIHAASAIIAAIASVSIVTLVGYQRARVAADNPGGFDDALAADLEQGTLVQRFAAWGRQFIKRAFVAHLILFQAVIGQLPALTEIWAYGAVGALVVVLAVHSRILQSANPDFSY